MTILRATFLGTSAAQPTRRRGLSATALRAHGDLALVDCGEGTQRQMLRFRVGLGLDLVLFTHFHADHYLGIIGLLRTLAMGDREAPLTLYGPGPFVTGPLRDLVHVGIGALPFPLGFQALAHGDRIERTGYSIRAVGVDHRTPALGYVVEEPARPGVFDVSRARAVGVPEGPLFGKLQSGEPIVTPGGRTVRPDEVLGPPRPGRKLALSGDTRPSDHFAAASRGANLMIHEATFSEANKARALETRHSTSLEAAGIAAQAGARRLALNHLSSRYDTRPHVLEKEARRAFGGEVIVAEDGMTLEVPFGEE